MGSHTERIGLNAGFSGGVNLVGEWRSNFIIINREITAMTSTSRLKANTVKMIKQYLYRLMPVKWRFTRIYHKGGWGCAESVSGRGSTLEVTESVRKELPALLANLNIRSVLDAPCGDFQWMRELLKEAPVELNYIGADIVSPLVNSLQKYKSKNVNFIVADIINDELPAVDLVFCRDCFIHFSERDIRKAISNFKKIGARFLVTNSFSDIDRYDDIDTGQWRQLNLELSPFNFPPPIFKISESGTNGKFLGVWELDKLPL